MRLQPYVGLPNILAEQFIVPELLQDDSTPEKLVDASLKLMSDTKNIAKIKTEFTRIHQILRQNTAEKAAEAIFAQLK